jgi:hypothetical protein
MRLAILLVSLTSSVLISSPASAILKHYNVQNTQILQLSTTNPELNKYPPAKDGSTAFSVGIVDDPSNGSPVLKRLLLVVEHETTTFVGVLSGFIFLSTHVEEGPRKALSFTGAGATDATIAWGVVTGWTVTGGFWCHSSPSNICATFAQKNLATTEPPLYSPHYDLGTWTFHGTGFTSVPFVSVNASLCPPNCGNLQYHLRGRLSAGLVPAVPIIGVTLLGASLLFIGVRLSR